MEEEQRNLDNAQSTPDEGQVEESTEISQQSLEEELGNIGMEEETQEEEYVDEFQEEEPTETEEVEEESQTITVDGQEFKSIDDLKKSYQEARKKISERNEKAKNFEKMQQYLEQNKEVAQMLQMADSDPNFKTLYKAYQNGYVNKDQLQKLNQHLQQQPQQKQDQVQNLTKEDVQNIVQQQTQQQQRITEAKMKMKNDYQQLSQEYEEVINEHGLDFDTLGKYALQHQYTDEQGVPDMQKALNHYVADNEDVFTMMQKMNENTVKQESQQKKKAQVESSSPKQQRTSDEDDLVDDILKYQGSSGGGVT